MEQPKLSRLAFDWLDALCILLIAYPVSFIFYLLDFEGPLLWIACGFFGATVVGPFLRRKWHGSPRKRTKKALSFGGLIATILIVFGFLAAAFGLLTLFINLNAGASTARIVQILIIGVGGVAAVAVGGYLDAWLLKRSGNEKG